MKARIAFFVLNLLSRNFTSAAFGHTRQRHWEPTYNFNLPRDTSNTTVTECGRDALLGNQSCPLNVCCSEFGNCGTTVDFCGKGCQSGCENFTRPACDAETSSGKRTVGYYQSWSINRPCGGVSPEELNVTGFTHINYGFLMFDPTTFAIASADANSTSLITRFTDLKTYNPGLQTWLAIGGWTFNDPGPTQTAFSDMASSPINRSKFILEVTHLMQTYAFDGLDLDWEYPSLPSRGGRPTDTSNLSLLVRELRLALGSQYGLSLTLPASYSSLRAFDLAAMSPHVDFFNLMSYDLHGAWDADTPGMGPFVRPHTNVTEIDAALDLLWRAGVEPEKVNMGLAFYGRSFTLKDTGCGVPNGVCEFAGAGEPGRCSGAEGTLDLREIGEVVERQGLVPTLEREAMVKYVVFNETQWVGYDDAETIAMKRAFADVRCLGGTMVWAMDQVDQRRGCGLPVVKRTVGGNASAIAESFGNDTAACLGQVVTATVPRTLPRAGGSLWSRTAGGACEALSKQYGIATGTLQTLSENAACHMANPFCAPAACALTQVSANTTSASIVTAASNFTSAQLAAWNPNVLGSWTTLTPGQYICTSPPGGWYILAPPPLANSSSSGSGLTANASSTAIVSTSTSTAPEKTQPGIVADCQSYATARAGDTCIAFAAANNIEPAQLYALNSILGANGSACTTQFWADESYCIAGGANANASSTISASSSGTNSPAPCKTQPGIAADYQSFATASKGDTCISFATANGIEVAQLYALNPVLGANGSACSTEFWAEESYCIGAGTNGISVSGGATGVESAPSTSLPGSTDSEASFAAPTSISTTILSNIVGTVTVPTLTLTVSVSASAGSELSTPTSPSAASSSGIAGTVTMPTLAVTMSDSTGCVILASSPVIETSLSTTTVAGGASGSATTATANVTETRSITAFAGSGDTDASSIKYSTATIAS